MQSRLQKDFHIKNILGSGAFGVVAKVEHKIEKKCYAIKIAQVEKAAEREIQNFVKIPYHKNVVHYITCWKDQFSRAELEEKIVTKKFSFQPGVQNLSFFCIQMELCDEDLRCWIRRNMALNIKESTHVFIQIVNGLKHIHNYNLIHRDLKPDNIFILRQQSNLLVKLGDFGLGKESLNSMENHTQGAGTPLYFAPEQFTTNYGKEVDIYALGIIGLEIFMPEKQPKSSDNSMEWMILSNIISNFKVQQVIPIELSKKVPTVADILLKMINVNPKLRPDFAKILDTFGFTPAANSNVADVPSAINLLANFHFSEDGIPNEHRKLIRELKDKGKLKNDLVENTMLKVDRGKYVAKNPYVDSPQAIGCSMNISAPHMHAMMLESIAEVIKPGYRVLDIGSGSGYVTTCLAIMVGSTGAVFGIEHMTDLADKSIQNITNDKPILIESGVVDIIVGDGRKGYKKGSPYDIIHVGAAAETFPDMLFEQLKENGRMIVPVGINDQKLYVVDKVKGQKVSKVICNVRFGLLSSQTSQLKVS